MYYGCAPTPDHTSCMKNIQDAVLYNSETENIIHETYMLPETHISCISVSHLMYETQNWIAKHEKLLVSSCCLCAVVFVFCTALMELSAQQDQQKQALT